MIVFKNKKDINLFTCEEKFCKEEGTRIWASSESKIRDLCETHYQEVTGE